MSYIDIASLTFDDFYNKVNASGKSHDSSAYNDDPEIYSEDLLCQEKVLQNFTVNNINFTMSLQLRDRAVDRSYIKERDPDTFEPISYYTRDELIKRLGERRYEPSILVRDIDSKKLVGRIQDEWGCTLVRVNSDYRKMGIGLRMMSAFSEMEPFKESGGCTPSGYKLYKDLHIAFLDVNCTGSILFTNELFHRLTSLRCQS